MHWKVTTIIVGIQQTLDNHVLTVQLELKANKLQIIYSRAKLVQPKREPARRNTNKLH